MAKWYNGVRIRITQRSLLEADLVRLIEALGYKSAMQRAGVPQKRMAKILRHWGPGYYIRKALHQEMQGLIQDIGRPLHG
jgi:hypothetical protein